jgi:CrcB protein
MKLFWVVLGGGLGSGARYLLSNAMLLWLGPAFPWGTLAVNVIGSFLLGVIAQLGAMNDAIPPMVRLALGTGVMGGFTTYSTFSVETWTYLEAGAWRLAFANVALTVAACLASTAAGFALARTIAS